jgi:bifunctional non-homologous end joining protein LigD
LKAVSREHRPNAAGLDVELEGRRLSLTSLDKVLWPEAGFTKGHMVDYYRRVAPVLVPHIAGRGLTLGRFPAGVDGAGFAQTECRGRPDWLATQPVRVKMGEVRNYCVVNDLPSLVWIANQGAIELHPFLAPGERPDRPSFVAFDLDPGPGADMTDCCEVAIWLREALSESGLSSFPKTSGSLGLHVFVPLEPSHTYARTKSFARTMAERLAADHPRQVTSRATKSLREGRVLVDWRQNDRSRSTVAVYSLRATPWPTVSTPVSWEEVEHVRAARKPELLTFLAGDVLDRVERFGDLFRSVLGAAQALPG